VKLAIDTYIYSDYAEGIQDVVDFMVDHGEMFCLPAVVIGELNFGFMKGSRQRYNENKLNEFINRLKINVIAVDQNVARKYGLIYFSLQRKGEQIPINDVWIAACCMEVGATLLTRDKHFLTVDQIETVVF